mmetsp:Transcript_36982/g.56655  ORF Transcript_36982/g.56655 Transcript_36982/m.56655 type:complete len:180 (-) Transcript_36982:159-698(-)
MTTPADKDSFGASKLSGILQKSSIEEIQKQRLPESSSVQSSKILTSQNPQQPFSAEQKNKMLMSGLPLDNYFQPGLNMFGSNVFSSLQSGPANFSSGQENQVMNSQQDEVMMQLIRTSGSQAITSMNGELINLTTEQNTGLSNEKMIRLMQEPDKLTTIKELTMKTQEDEVIPSNEKPH